MCVRFSSSSVADLLAIWQSQEDAGEVEPPEPENICASILHRLEQLEHPGGVPWNPLVTAGPTVMQQLALHSISMEAFCL